jgi:hypothetical protein
MIEESNIMSDILNLPNYKIMFEVCAKVYGDIQKNKNKSIEEKGLETLIEGFEIDLDNRIRQLKEFTIIQNEIDDAEILKLCEDAKTHIENLDNCFDHYVDTDYFLGSNMLTFNYVQMPNVFQYIQKNDKKGVLIAKTKRFNSFQELNDKFKDEDLVFVHGLDIKPQVFCGTDFNVIEKSNPIIFIRCCTMSEIEWMVNDDA